MSSPPAVRSVAAVTDVGQVRDHNEDCYLVRSDLGLYLVADGMGGHQAGEVASAMVQLCIADFFEATASGGWSAVYDEPGDEHLAIAARRLAAAIRKSNHDVYTVANEHAAHWGMGSTVVALHLPEGSPQMCLAHVGDSRAYLIRDATLEQLTRDHSLVSEALALDPNMSEEDLARLPSNIITRALGVDVAVRVDVRSVVHQPGDVVLLCSDGLSGLISDGEILQAIQLIDTAEEVCELLVALANDAGGHDNITVLVLKL